MENQAGSLTAQNILCKICGKPYIKKELNFLKHPVYIAQCDCEEKKRIEENKEKLFRTIQEKYREPFWKSMDTVLFKEWVFENFKAPDENIRNSALKVWQYVNDYISNKIEHLKPGLFLTGNTGNRKTYLAISAANFMIKKYITTVFVDMPNLLDLLREGYKKDNYFQIMNILSKVNFLVLDDVGIEKLEEGSWVKEKIYQIINNRYVQRKGIIITSQYNLKQLESRLGNRITRRIKDMCNVVGFGGGSYEVS